MENVNDISRCKEDERARNLRKDILALVQNQIDPLDAMPGRVIAISATYNSLVILVLQIISGVAPRLTEDEAHEIRKPLEANIRAAISTALAPWGDKLQRTPEYRKEA
jgi:hypothetical protein